jgi:VCBS repeat-containing protein
MTKKLQRKQKIFIEALEQRIMLDGAGASTFLDLIDDSNQQEIKKNSKIIDTTKDNNEVPFANVARDQSRKSVVFIDSAVADYETIINSFKENTEFYLINSNEDGFKKIDEILNDRKDIDALHIIGHGSAGQILFGNAFLNNDTITNYQATLASIGQSLTTSGDILFYGCNVASTEQGEILIKKISEITKADIAASDDLTGKDGDWDLEKEEGFIDVKNLNVKNYDHSLDSLTTSGIVSGSGVTHIASGNVDMLTSSQTKMGIRDRGIYSHISSPNTQYGLALERSNVSVASGKIISNINIDVTDTGLTDQLTSGNAYIAGDSDQTASESMTVNSYLVAYVGNQNRTSSSRFGSAVFDGEIVGIFFDQAYTRGQTVNGVQYHSSSFTYDMRNNSHTSNLSDSDGGRVIENPNFYAYNRTSDSVDWVSVGNYGSGTNNYLSFGFTNNNAKTGDYIRVIVKQIESNSAPVAVNDTDSVNEDATVTRTTGSNLKMADDSDPDGDSITVTQIAKTGASNSSVAGSSTYNSNGTSVTGTYGTLVVGANGTYTYVADQSAADDLDAGDTATDSFTYTISDGTNTDTATLIFTVTGVNDTPTGADNTVSTSEETPYVFSTSDFGYTDVDDDDVLVSVKITTLEDDGDLQYYDGSSWQDVTLNQVITVTDISNGYLRLNPDANDTGSPYTTFEFSVNDGEADSVSSYTMTINVTTVNDDPVADNETNTATEGTTTTVTDGTSDLLYGDTDTDGDTLEVSGIRTGTESGSGTSGSIGTALTGTYGSLTINSDGTYTYTPNQDFLGDGETGVDYFTYTVSDGNGGTDTGQISITVTGVNDAPVGVNDSNAIGIATTSTLTATNGSTKDILTNDTDPDTNDTLTVTAIRTGATEGGGTAGTLGEALEGTFGSLTINSNGSYTYIVNEGLTDTLDPTEVVYEYFNYSFSDGNGGTDSASIVIKLQNIGGVIKDIRDRKVERLIKQESRKEQRIKVEKIDLKVDQLVELDLNNFEFEKSNIKTDYSQGLKLINLVAETDSLQLSEGELSNLKVKNKESSLNLKFNVMNEQDSEIVKFVGKMTDGSELPNWIKVNPKTGKTSANIPSGVEKIEIVIVATDKNNQTREIAVKIDPEKIKKDKQIVKKAKRTNSSITVNENGTVDIVKRKEDGSIERSFNKTLNFDNQIDINEIIETYKPEKTFQLKTVDSGTDLIVNLPNELIGSFERSKLVLKDGSDVPEWLEYNPLTGEISAENPPSDLSLLELKLIIENDGKITVRDLEIDLENPDISENIDTEEKNKFVAFNDQLEREFNDWDDYGNNLINRL